jgi:hypothetical protein
LWSLRRLAFDEGALAENSAETKNWLFKLAHIVLERNDFFAKYSFFLKKYLFSIQTINYHKMSHKRSLILMIMFIAQ